MSKGPSGNLVAELRLRAVGITPTIESCNAYRQGKSDVLSTYELERRQAHEAINQSTGKEQE